jgi:hypothetical protein
MPLSSSDNLKASVSRENPDHYHKLQNLKASVKSAYKCVREANKKAHQNNKRLYDRKAKFRKFEIGDLVYLYNPTMKCGLSKKFRKSWSGPYQVTRVITHLNYEIMDQNNKKQIVHVNRIKPAYNSETWNPKTKLKVKKEPPKKTKVRLEEEEGEEEEETRVGIHLLLNSGQTEVRMEPEAPPDQSFDTPEAVTPVTDTPTSEFQDPTYLPSQTPRSRMELQTTRVEQPVTRSRARILSTEPDVGNTALD